MAASVSLRRLANTVLVVVGAFLVGGALHRSLVTGETQLLAAEPIARIVLGAAILAVAYAVWEPGDERGFLPGREDSSDDAGGEEV